MIVIFLCLSDLSIQVESFLCELDVLRLQLQLQLAVLGIEIDFYVLQPAFKFLLLNVEILHELLLVVLEDEVCFLGELSLEPPDFLVQNLDFILGLFSFLLQVFELQRFELFNLCIELGFLFEHIVVEVLFPLLYHFILFSLEVLHRRQVLEFGLFFFLQQLILELIEFLLVLENYILERVDLHLFARN